MDKGTKRKRDSNNPILSYSAPGHKKFAKFFTGVLWTRLFGSSVNNVALSETSLGEIKETVRKRLNLSSTSEFTLFYDTNNDTDISLENGNQDDDFDVFEVRVWSGASDVHVVIKISSTSQAIPENVTDPPNPIPVEGQSLTDESRLPRKKRKVDAHPSHKTPSSAPHPKNQKNDAAAAESISAPPLASAPSLVPETVSQIVPEPTSPKKRKKKVRKDANNTHAAFTGTLGDPPNIHTVPGTPSQPPKKKLKKDAARKPSVPVAPTMDQTPAPPLSGEAVQSDDGPSSTETGEPSQPKSTSAPVKELVKTTDVSSAQTAEKPRRKSKSKQTELSTSDPSPAAPSEAIQEPSEPVMEVKKGKRKAAQQDADATVLPSATSKQSTKRSKQSTAENVEVPKSVKFDFPEELAEVISSTDDNNIVQNARSSKSGEKAKKTKGKKKTPQDLHDVGHPDSGDPQNKASVDPESVKAFLRSLLPVAPDSPTKPSETMSKPTVLDQPSPRTTAENPAAPIPCPVCGNSPSHLRYRCPIVLGGAGRIRQRIAELQQDEDGDNSKLIQELRALAEKSQKTGNTAQASGSRDAASVRKAPTYSRPPNDSDSDESETSVRIGKTAFHSAAIVVDPELEAIMRGPSSSRLTVDDVDLDEADDAAENVMLEDDDEDDIDFRRRSRRIEAADLSSGEEDDDDEENHSADHLAESEPPSVLNTSIRADSRSSPTPMESADIAEEIEQTIPVPEDSASVNSEHSSPSSVPEPLGAIAGRQSVDVDLAGDKAVDEAMASDSIMFGLETHDTSNGNAHDKMDSVVNSPSPSPAPALPHTPISRPPVANEPIHSVPNSPSIPEPARRDLDPIQPAEDFPPTPLQPTKALQPTSPSTPRMIQRMKDRNGRSSVKLSQLELPFSLNPQSQRQRAESPLHPNSQLVATQPAEEAADGVAVDKPTTRRSTRSTRLTPAASKPELSDVPPSELEQPAKRRRGPNKTAEQRAEEAAAKLAAKEEKERIRKEKAEAKQKAKTQTKAAAKHNVQGDSFPTTPPRVTPPRDSTETPKAAQPLTPASQDGWTVIKPSSSQAETQESLRDELRSSSPSNEDHTPLFLPAESQAPFPYSQWNSVPDSDPGTPKDSPQQSEDEEEEVAASMKLSQRPVMSSAYRRLTDIASQPSLFSTTPTSRTPKLLPATFPSKDKRELYPALPREDDSDSDSSAAEAASHIPKSRRAGKTPRLR
ncbi:carbamoyl-phosphate synthase arginine-specific small chain [Favolaschia claudopus]|uniref:Carbamoyl-phosphate synthase arginine-specific small chain n=1 Tax=Favolaschia claudopus TaxID=2862362 RepID=A0AAW0AA07_9AGAR